MPKATLPLPILAVALGLCAAACSPEPVAAPKTAASAPAPAPAPTPACDCAGRVTERVLVSPARQVRKLIPAVTRQENRTVVRPAWTETVTTPAVFKTVWRNETTPGPVLPVETPARYRTVSEPVLIPAHGEWRASAGRPVSGAPRPGGGVYAPTGEVMCWVQVPARYEMRLRNEMVSPPGHSAVQGPPVTRQVAEQVQVSPAVARQVRHEAVSRVERQTIVVTPARTVVETVPAVYREVTRAGPAAPCARAAAPRPHHRPPRPHPVEQTPAPAGAPYGERG